MSEETKSPAEPPRNRGRVRSDDRRGAGPRSRTGGGRTRGSQPDMRPGEELVLVQFKGHRKSYYHNRRDIPVRIGQYCLVEADRGRDMGRVLYIGTGRPEWWKVACQQGVLDVAGEMELARLHANRGDEWDFWEICQEKIQARRLKMNLVTVERQFDHKKVTFYFTAEKRVDFRELVRDLAAVFRTRIELRQIGVRDEARLKGGIGVCGREFCCASFMHDFVPVTLKMAKVQHLPLNPGKLSGPCGRLRCCLTYENEQYRASRRCLPKVGTRVESPAGVGTVRKVNLLLEEVTVDHDEGGGVRDWPLARLVWSDAGNLPPPRRPARDHDRCDGEGGCRGSGSH